MRMLDTLRVQWLQLHQDGPPVQQSPAVGTLDTRLEILFVYDSEAARHNLEQQTAGRFTEPEGAFAPRFIEGKGLSYYQMKHCGAQRSNGDILIFLDSDVVPEPGWLPALLDAVLDDRIQVVCGNTYIDPRDLLGKVFALGWFFPLRSLRSGIEAGARCFENNLAFRADVYRACPFVEIPGTTRNSMRAQSQCLASLGVGSFKCHDAQVSHPPPRNLGHFLRRALAHGRDVYFQTNHDAGHGSRDGRLGGALRGAWQRYTTCIRRILHDYRRVDLSALLIPFALAIMALYYLVFAAGSLATHVAPGAMSRQAQL